METRKLILQDELTQEIRVKMRRNYENRVKLCMLDEEHEKLIKEGKKGYKDLMKDIRKLGWDERDAKTIYRKGWDDYTRYEI